METIYFKPGKALTFHSVVSVRESLWEALKDDTKEAFCLDVSNVLHCDSAGLAFLLETRKLCNYKNKQFDVIGISPQMRSLAEFCGVQELILC